MQLIKLIRPANFFITFISGIVAVILAGEFSLPLSIYLSVALSASLTAAGGNIINDYFDIETDKINKPDRPIPGGRISKAFALKFYFIVNIFALVFAIPLGLDCVLIVIIIQLLLYFYSFKLKSVPLTGNILVASLTGAVFLYGGFAAGSINSVIIPAVFAFLINLIRELLKDLEDMKGDSLSGIITLPLKKNVNFTKWLIFSITVFLILFTFHPFIYSYYSIEYFIIAMTVINPLLVFFLKSLFRDDFFSNINRFSRLLKFNMLMGLIAIFAGR